MNKRTAQTSVARTVDSFLFFSALRMSLYDGDVDKQVRYAIRNTSDALFKPLD